MEIVIIGGGGLVGHKLAARLATLGSLRRTPISRLILADIVEPELPEAPFEVRALTTDIADPASVARAIGPETALIFHLAAIVSAHAEADFEAGLSINLMGSLNILERARALGTAPVVVFTSSIAVFGGEVPDPITDATLHNPQTSYGTQKAAAELLLNDHSRRGFVDGRGLRLPTISVRPGKPNRAASAFMSAIIREPLGGLPAICPVGRDFAHYYLSPRRCVDNLVVAAEAEAGALGLNRCMTMPGRSWTIGQMIDAMTAVAGPGPADLIRFEPEPVTARIVSGWRSDFQTEKALALGMRADESFEDNVRFYLEDDLPAA